MASSWQQVTGFFFHLLLYRCVLIVKEIKDKKRTKIGNQLRAVTARGKEEERRRKGRVTEKAKMWN